MGVTKRLDPQFNERFMAQAVARRQRALELREAGKTYEEIGEALGISRQRAHGIVRRAKLEAGAASGVD